MEVFLRPLPNGRSEAGWWLGLLSALALGVNLPLDTSPVALAALQQELGEQPSSFNGLLIALAKSGFEHSSSAGGLKPRLVQSLPQRG